MSHSPRRVVITGMGAVTPLGKTAPESWRSALEGRSGIRLIKGFDTTDCPVKFAGEIQDFDLTTISVPSLRPKTGEEPLTQIANSKELRRLGRFIQLALAAGFEAYQDAGIDPLRSEISAPRIGVNIGVGMGGLPEIEATHTELREKGYRRISPFFIPQTIPNLAAGQLSILLGLQGPNLCIATACSSGAHSIGESFRAIQLGFVDAMMAGGSESVVSPLGIGGFAAMKALSTRNDDPETASRPFDLDRDGFVMGEGSAMLFLEEYEHAKRRGAKMYAEIVGYGLSGDAYHMTSPSPSGEGGARAMKQAIAEAGIHADRIGYVNAHATSTPAGDTEEARGIASLFSSREAARKTHVSGTKSMTGHLLGAAGAIEAIFAALAVKEGKIPPTRNLKNLDPGCEATGLDFTANSAVSKPVEYALSNSFGFGGTNASLLIGRIHH